MADTNTHRIRTVPVAGGDLTVCEWNPEATRTVVAIHGVTSTHVDWAYLGESVPQDLRVIAPDLRGRGRSAGLAGPWGMAQHARDVVSILDAFGIERGLLVGHSMGGFVAVLTAVEHRGRTSGLVLVDGGLPAVDANVDDDALTRAVLAEARERLEVVYPTVQAYVEAVGATDPIAVRRATYDLVPTAGGYRIAGDYAAIAADAQHIAGDASAEALAALDRPALLLRAPRGLPPREEGLYSEREVAGWAGKVASLTAVTVPDTDHGTIMSSPAGVAAIRTAIATIANA